MKFPKPIEEQTNATQRSQAFVDGMIQVYELCDQILNRNGGTLQCQTYDALIDAAINARDAVKKLYSKDPAIQQQYIQSLMTSFKSSYGIDYTKQEVIDMLQAMETLLDTFVPAAHTDQPKSTETHGCLFLSCRADATGDYKKNAYSVDPMPQSTLDIVQPLFDGFA